VAQATNGQMQSYADQRIRVRAQTWRNFIAALRDDKAGIDSVYERAVSANAWSDARSDGPPKLLANQDILSYNSFITLLLKLVDTGLTAQEVTDLRAQLAPVLTTCVNPL
jgi:hypothetical protein